MAIIPYSLLITLLNIIIMNIIDTRDLVKERELIKEEILSNFKDNFEDDIDTFENIKFSENLYGKEEIDIFTRRYKSDLENIKKIDKLEEEINNREFYDGITLILEDDFVSYCEEMVIEWGYIDKDLPYWIEIDWEATADNMRSDYHKVEFEGKTYLYTI